MLRLANQAAPVIAQDQLIGVGLYTFGQAASLLGLPVSVLRDWVGAQGEVASILPRKFAEDDLLTFSELMELHFVKLFRNAGVSFQAIRKVARAAQSKFDSPYPFSIQRFDTDGKTIFATLKSEETNRELIEDLQKGQVVFQTVIRPFFKKLDYGAANDISRFWPMKKNGRVVLDPNRRFGQPIDAEAGVSTEAISQAVNAGGGQDAQTVARWFDIPLEAVEAAIRFERSLAT